MGDLTTLGELSNLCPQIYFVFDIAIVEPKTVVGVFFFVGYFVN
jgi:hypothetical protein